MKLLKCVLLMICLFKKKVGKVLSYDLDKVNEVDCMNQENLISEVNSYYNINKYVDSPEEPFDKVLSFTRG